MKLTHARIPAGAQLVVRNLRRHKFEAYLVGGAIRDLVLRRSPRDWDVATDAKPSKIERIFPKTVATGKKFGTITVLTPGLPIQVTTYRSEGAYRDRRRPSGVAFHRSLKDDLARRDFTINAMALDPKTRELIDPFSGLKDLRKKCLRSVGPAKARLSEDALRAVRAGRFIAELGFRPEASLTKAAKGTARHVKRLSGERIRDELSKLLVSPKPSLGFRWLDRAGILRVILPELTRCKGVAQGGWHTFDVYRHSLESVDAAEPDLVIRLALLLHDIAKPKTRTREGRRYHFYRHERIGADMARKVLRRLRFPNTTVDTVTTLIRHHLFEAEPISKSDAAVRRLMRRVGPDQLEALLEFRRADIKGCGPKRRVTPALKTIARRARKIRKAQEALTVRDLAIGGTEVMKLWKIAPGPLVGRTLDQLLEIVLTNPKLNNKRDLRRLLKDLPYI